MTDDIVLDEKDRMDFWSFIEAPHAKTDLKITTIYLSLGTSLLNNYPTKVGEFIADAHSRGLVVEYLTGDPRWALSDYNQASFDELEDLLAYNAAASEEARFDGYHQDTEPYTLGNRPGDPLIWGVHTETIWDQFVATTQAWKDRIDTHNEATGDDLIIGSAIPFWLDSNEDGITSNEHIQDIVDYVSIMNYDTREGFHQNVESEIDHASTNGKDVYVGVETLELGYKEPEPDSFFQQLYTPSASYFYGRDGGKGTLGIEGLSENIALFESTYENSPAYKGIAFHFYEDISNGDNALRALGHEPYEHAPAAWIISPSHIETLSGIETIRYVVYDPDGDELNVLIEYSSDAGASWSTVSELSVTESVDEITCRTVQWDVSSLDPGDDYLLRVTATEANKAMPLIGYDQSDYAFFIVTAKADTANPAAVEESSIDWSYDTYGEINLWWEEPNDSTDVTGYYYSYLPNNPYLGSFSRGNRVRLKAPSVDSILYLWTVDSSGNLSAPVTYEILAIEDIDQDGIVDDDEGEVDRDGDGVSDSDEASEGSNPDDPLDFDSSRLLGYWEFEGTLENSLIDEPNLVIDDDNGAFENGSLGYTTGALAASQAIEISGSEPVWLPLETNPASHSDIYALTIEMWIRPDLNTKDELSFIPLACFGDLDAGLTLLLKNDGDLLSVRRYTDEASGTYNSINAQNDELFDGGWHHVACSYNGYSGALKLYIDGELVRSGLVSEGPLQNTRILRFLDGRSNADNHNNNGGLVHNSGQFENNAHNFTSEDSYPIRYLGLIDNIKVTKAVVPVELLGYYQEQNEDYTTWRAGVFGTDGSDDTIGGIQVDYSKDGISNFLAYASGLDPTVNNSATFMNTPIIETRGEKDYLSLRYLESKTAETHFQVQTKTSLDASTWFNQTDAVSYLDGDSEKFWIKKVSLPFDDESGQLFMRLSISTGSD